MTGLQIVSFAFLDFLNPYFLSGLGDNVPNKYGAIFDMPAPESQLFFMYKDAEFQCSNYTDFSVKDSRLPYTLFVCLFSICFEWACQDF